MRIVLLSDVHGNLLAFEAAIEHARKQRPDLIVNLGDNVVGSPDSAACWRRAVALDCPMIRGNHERYVTHFGTERAPAAWAGNQFAPVRWAREQCTAQELEAMERLPLYLRLPELPGVLFVHASPRDDRDTVAAHTPEAELAAMFAGSAEPWIFRAHNHWSQVRLWGDRTIVTNGSIGNPMDGVTTAQYATIEYAAGRLRFAHHSVPYDIDAAVRRFDESGYMDAVGPMGRIYRRELATATLQIVPFLQRYQQWSRNEAVPLDQAVERFLNMY